MKTSDRPLLAQAQDLAAFLPARLVCQVLADGLPVPGRPERFEAAVLFADISGFTPMSEELASDGPRGAEELNRVLLQLFTAMMALIRQAGGTVSHFYGDGLVIYFPVDSGGCALGSVAAANALACAHELQALILNRFARVVTRRPPGREPGFPLEMKIGAGYGRCVELIVGSEQAGLEFVLAGEGVEEATSAENLARAGEVLASATVRRMAGLPVAAPFQQLVEALPMPESSPLLAWGEWQNDDYRRLIRAAGPFLPPALYQRILSGDQAGLAEHRPVTSLFVQFDGLDYAAPAVGTSLQRYYLWVAEVVARYGEQNSRVNRILTGDKGNQLHIIFGAPVAPDAPQQALRCALALQRERPDFITSQKIGVAAGRVFASPVGSQDRHEYTLVGDVANLSARLTGICHEGAVLIDDVTAARAGPSFDLKTLPPTHLKGRTTPITLYEVNGERPLQSQLQAFTSRRPPTLVGREEDMTAIQASMDEALAGRGRVMALTGAAGVGKTQLLSNAVRYWLEAGGHGYVGACQQHLADSPFSPWSPIWRELFGLRADMTAEAQAQALVTGTQALCPDVGDDVGLWAEILSLPVPRSEVIGQLPAPVRQARFFSLVRRCLQGAAAEKPLLLIFEDVHWADQSTRDLLNNLADFVADRPIMISVTLRLRGESAPRLLDHANCTALALSPLSVAQARLYLQQRLGVSRWPAELDDFLGLQDDEGDRRQINPLFLEEATRALLATGAVQVNGRVRVNSRLLSELQLPDTIHGLLLARFDRLPVAARDLLQVAAVVGEHFELDILADVINQLTGAQLRELLTQLGKAEIMQEIVANPQPVYSFQHAMTREVVYETLSFARRRDLHMAVAGYLETRHAGNLAPYYPTLAYHYGRTDSHEKGLHYAFTAGHDALALYANKEAVELFNIAERHLQSLPEEAYWDKAADIYLYRSRARRYQGDFNGANRDAKEALRLALAHSDAVRMAKANNATAAYIYHQARYDEVLTITTELIETWSEQIPDHDLARAQQWAGMAAAALRQYETALDHLRQAEQICRGTNDSEMLARVLNAMAFVYYSQDQLEPALEAMQRSVNLARDFSMPDNTVSGLSNISLIQFRLGLAAEALQTVDEALVLANATSRSQYARILPNKACILAYLGDFDEAQVQFEASSDLLALMEDEYGLVETYLLWGFEYSSVLRDWADAERRFRLAEQLIDRQPEHYREEQVRLWLGQAQVELNAGSLSQAEQRLELAQAQIERHDFSWWRPLSLYFLAQAKISYGDYLSARTLLEKGLVSVAERGCPDYLPLILLSLAHVTRDTEQKQEYLQQCLAQAAVRARYQDRLDCEEAARTELTRLRSSNRAADG